MATSTLRPNGTYASSSMSAVGAASLHAATNDNTDSSYGDATSFGATVDLDLDTVTIPTGAQVRSVTPRVRLGAGDSTGASFGLYNGSSVLTQNNVTPTPTITTFTGAAETLGFGGAAWSQSMIDSLKLRAVFLTAAHAIYEGYVDVVYNERPVATVTTPSEGGTVTNDSTPSIAWTYSDPEGDIQERVRVKVFSSAQYGAGGFDPETSTPTWDSGELFTSAATVDVDTILANDTYRAYVKTADAGSGGRYSAWDYNQFTLNVTPPPNPTIAATVQAAQSRTKVDVTASASAPNTEFVVVDYSDDAGASWSTLRGGTKTALAPSATLTIYDYEAPPGASRRYRARAGRTV